MSRKLVGEVVGQGLSKKKGVYEDREDWGKQT